MSLVIKKRLLRLLLAVIVIWPACHIYVVQRTGLSPWKGAGWAMYCTPRSEIDISFHPYDADGNFMTRLRRARLFDLASEQYLKEMENWSQPDPPDFLATLLLKENADIRTLTITVRAYTIDADSGLVAEQYLREFKYKQPSAAPSGVNVSQLR